MTTDVSLTAEQLQTMTPEQIQDTMNNQMGVRQIGDGMFQRNEAQSTIMPGFDELGDERAVVYDRESGYASIVLKAHLPQLLTRVRVDDLGNRHLVYTVHKHEAPEPKQPRYVCHMHDDSAQRGLCDEFGFQVCRKRLQTPADVEAHMKGKHTREYQAIKDYENLQERKEEREWRHSMTEGFQAILSRYEAAVTPEPEPAPSPVFNQTMRCGDVLESTARIALVNKVKAHENNCDACRMMEASLNDNAEGN